MFFVYFYFYSHYLDVNVLMDSSNNCNSAGNSGNIQPGNGSNVPNGSGNNLLIYYSIYRHLATNPSLIFFRHNI